MEPISTIKRVMEKYCGYCDGYEMRPAVWFDDGEYHRTICEQCLAKMNECIKGDKIK
jgi:hypothetical protein